MPPLRFLLAQTLFALGVALLCLNVWGLLSPNDQRNQWNTQTTSYSAALKQIAALERNLHETTIEDVTHVIHNAMRRGVPPTSSLRVPPRQNWILYSLTWADPLFQALGLTNLPHLFREYQMTHPWMALERGFGICSQQSLVLAGIFMERFSIPASLVNLNGHVLVQTEWKDGTLFLADPIFNVALPFGLKTAESHPNQVATRYPKNSYVPALFGSHDNRIIPGGPRGFNPKLYWIERTSYILIWVIPILLLLPQLLDMLRRQR